MNTRPDFTLRLEVLANRLKYLVEQKQEIDRQIAIYTDEHDKLIDLQSLYPDDPIDIERAVPLPSELKKTEPAKRTRRSNNDTAPRIKEAIEKYGPLTLGELVAELKDVSRGTVSSSLTLMKHNGKILAPEKFGGPYRLP